MMSRLLPPPFLLFAMLSAGCGATEVSDCQTPEGEGYLCPKGTICAPEGTPAGCYEESQLADDCQGASWDPNAAPIACSTNESSTDNGYCLGQICEPSDCGDGIVSGVEICDGGDSEDFDENIGWYTGSAEDKKYTCSKFCTSELKCGDNRVDDSIGEVCDDGNTDSGDGCSADCTLNEFCGNGQLDTINGVEEDCDPGKGDNKNASWDEIAYEFDEHGNWIDPEGNENCSRDCRSDLKCGNGIKDGPFGPDDFVEACDDGGTAPGDGCNAECTGTEQCGDGFEDKEAAIPEVCDPGENAELWESRGIDRRDEFGNWRSGEEPDRNKDCASDCRSRIIGCGNGVLEGAERCDDGNWSNHDGCNSQCRREALSWKQWEPPRSETAAAMAYDPIRGETLMLSGVHPTHGTTLMWKWAPSLNSWHRIEAAQMPTPRDQPAMAFDEEQGVMVALGEASTWQWDGNHWTEFEDGVFPGLRTHSHDITYHGGLKKVVTVAEEVSETWDGQGEWQGSGILALYSWSDGIWSPVETNTDALGALADDVSHSFGLAYDVANDALLFLGGIARETGRWRNGLLALTGPPEALTWSHLAPYPWKILAPTLVHHPGEGRTYVLGDSTSKSTSALSYVTIEDGVATWARKANAGRGQFRQVGGSLSPDPDNPGSRYILVSGGTLQNGKACSTPNLAGCPAKQCDHQVTESNAVNCEVECQPTGNRCESSEDCGEGSLCVERSATNFIRASSTDLNASDDNPENRGEVWAEITSLLVASSPAHPTVAALSRPSGYHPWLIHVDRKFDTWRFDGVSWERRANGTASDTPAGWDPTSPGPFPGSVAALDGQNIWLWSEVTSTWTQFSPSSNSTLPTSIISRGFGLLAEENELAYYVEGELFIVTLDESTSEATWSLAASIEHDWPHGRLISTPGETLAVGDSPLGDIMKLPYLSSDPAMPHLVLSDTKPGVNLQNFGAAYDLDRQLIILAGLGPQDGPVATFELALTPPEDSTFAEWVDVSNVDEVGPRSRFTPGLGSFEEFGVALCGGSKNLFGTGNVRLSDTWSYGYRSPLPDEQCGNEVDDDGDGLVDCIDEGDCRLSPFCRP